MTNSPYVKAVIAQSALRVLPPLICKTLIEDANFRDEYGLESDAVLSFGDSGVSVQRSELYNAVRKVLSGESAVEVSDNNGQNLELKIIGEEGGFPSLQLSRSKQHLILPNLAVLSPDANIRLCYLNQVTSDVNLPSSVQEEWRNILNEHALADEEVDSFYSEYHDTPVEQAQLIRSRIMEGHITVSSLVPTSRRYYERLIGTFDESNCIINYAAGSGRAFLEQLSSWQPYEGFLYSLLLSSHPSLTAEIHTDRLSCEELIRAFEFLDKNGDRISQLGAIEVGLRIMHSRPEIEQILIRLIKQLRDDVANEKENGFSLISAMFILVDGELSRIRLFTKEPPFYRRLAALSQSALICRQLINSPVNIQSFFEWAFRSRAQQYYLQSLTDMRLEPCWSPEFSDGPQLKANFLGRILIASHHYKQNIKTRDSSELFSETSSESLYSFCKFPYSYYPGPLEGTEDNPKILPVEISKAIETQLRAEEVTVKSFIALVNSALIFRVGADQAELAAKALKLGSYRLTDVENRSQLLAILNGLATVAAITRSHLLADELRILVRIYRRDPQFSLSIEEATRICLVASSSRKDLKEWRNLAGEWLTELAFSDLEDSDGEVLYSYLQCLCQIVPELWINCGRADAALMAYNARTC